MRALIITLADSRRLLQSCSQLMVLIIGIGGAFHCGADDVVTVDSRGRVERRTGTVIDFRGATLTLQLGTRQIAVPASGIEQVVADWNPAHRQGDNQFEQRQYAAALASYDEALGAEQRLWVKRRLLSQIVTCLANLGRYRDACAAFERLVNEDPNTPYLACIPLAWRTEHVANLEPLLTPWLTASAPPSLRLLAISWLLPTRQQDATRWLRELARGDDAQVASLAVAQLFRVQMANGIQSHDVQRLQDHVATIDEPLRAGPYFLLGLAHARAEQWDAAAIAMLRVPSLYSHDGLAQRAFVEAAKAMEAGEQPDDARVLWQQAVAWESTSSLADYARQQLDRNGQP